MLSDHIKTAVTHGLNIVFQRCFTGGGVNAFLPEALVKQTGQKNWFIVDIDVFIVVTAILRFTDFTLTEIEKPRQGHCRRLSIEWFLVKIRGIKVPKYLVCDFSRIKFNNIFTCF